MMTCNECKGEGCEVCNWLGWTNRLKLAAPESVKENPPDIALALQHHLEINKGGRRWAKLDIIQFATRRVVHLDIGTVHTNGEKERAHATYSYFVADGKADYTTFAYA